MNSLKVRKLSVESLATSIPKEAGQAQPQVIIVASTLERIWEHVKSNKHREVGGILVGDTLYQDQSIKINIKSAIRGQKTKSSIASLCFTFDTWDDFYKKCMLGIENILFWDGIIHIQDLVYSFLL